MSTAEPTTDLLWRNKIDCLQALNRTERFYNPGTFISFFFYLHFLSSKYANNAHFNNNKKKRKEKC